MIAHRGPVIRMVNAPSSSSGFSCCCCRCFTCINTGFLQSLEGVLKIIQVILALFCQSLAVNFGLPYAATMGSAYHGFLSTVSWGFMTSLLLLISCVFSAHSHSLIRQSLFEVLFSGTAAFSYISSSMYLAFAVNTFLYPQYLLVPYFQVFPAMTAVYVFGTFVGVLHGYDTYRAYKFYKGYR